MPEIFVSPDRVATHDDYVVVDVRREGEYADAHIPDAVHVPFERFRDPSDEMDGKLPRPERFESLLVDVGISQDDKIVAYDDDFGVYASRFLVTAEVLGHEFDRLHLLDGDIETWTRNHETTDTNPNRETTEYTCRPTTDGPLVSADELETCIDEDAVIVDTRDRIEYDTVHLPGAIHFQWRGLVDEKARRRKSRAEIESVLTANGIVPAKPIRLYCNTARRLSFVYAVLRDLGYEDVAFYEGGIDAWADYGGPVETSRS
jgi:thiosulfate/3-mercaptopyruvate sulfurtransferase